MKQAICGKYAVELKSKFSGCKLKQGHSKDVIFEIRDYVHQMNLSDAKLSNEPKKQPCVCQKPLEMCCLPDPQYAVPLDVVPGICHTQGGS